MLGAYEVVVGLVVGAIVVGGAAFLLYFVRLNPSRIPDPKIRHRPMRWMWASFFSFWFVVAFAMGYAESAIVDWSLTFELALYLVPALFWTAVLSLGFAKWVFDRRASGPTLLDLAPAVRTRGLPKWAALPLIASGVAAGAAWLPGVSDDASAIYQRVFWSVLLVTLGVLTLVQASPGLKICQNGIWIFQGLLKWGTIKSYHWEGEPVCVLMIQTRSKLPFLHSGAIAFPTEHVDATKELLKENCLIVS